MNKKIIVLVWAICIDLGYQPAWVSSLVEVLYRDAVVQGSIPGQLSLIFS